MASSATVQDNAASIISSGSDYGSDLDEATVGHLLSRAESQETTAVALDNIEKPAILDDHGGSEPLARLARVQENWSTANTRLHSTCGVLPQDDSLPKTSVEVEYDEHNRAAFSPYRSAEGDHECERSASAAPQRPDSRTPLQRFRTPPKKPLSVTDIISPAWCELQYWYSLTRYGRIRKTPAMKQGSKVHRILEEQVHTEVPIDVATKEDRFALRIWNIVQGLRTLRRTGMTRELEVWGVIEGEVVNGVIDQITTTSPDEEMEVRILKEAGKAQVRANNSRKRKTLSPDQRTLADYLPGSQSNSYKWLGTLHEKPRTLYIVDIKTRQSKTLPPADNQLRPTHFQLMMYHRLFCALAANDLPAQRIFDRYDVNPNVTFSDQFIAQMSAFDIGFEREQQGDVWAPEDSSQDSVSELLSHNNLTSLWALMITEFSKIIPDTTDFNTSSISPLLTAEFRTPGEGALIGKRSFVFDAAALEAYVRDELKWWRGERSTKGVDIEDAYKCRICEFAETCTWRKTKIEEGIRKARLRQEKGRQSQV